MKKLAYLLAFALIAGTWACSDDDKPGPKKGEGEKTSVKLTLSIKDYNVDGTAREDSRTSLNNVWILCFNSEGANVQALKESRLDVGTQATTDVIAGSNMKYVIVANVDAATVFNPGTLTYNEFLDAVYTTSITNADAIPLVGTVSTSVTSDGQDLGNVELERIAASLSFKFTYASNGYNVKSVTLKNVVRYPYYIGKTDYSSLGSDAFVNKDPLVPDDSYHTYYISENPMGTVSGISSEKDKVTDKQATYIEILAEKEMEDHRVLATYRYYPGDNKTTDFNIRRNNEYTVTETVNFEDEQDKRITRITKGLTIEASEANCYMLDPTSAKEIAIPVTRVNEFWRSPDGGDMGNVIDDGSGKGGVKSWVARQIISDSELPLIELINAEGTSAYESIVIKPAGNNAEGNVLIGIFDATAGTPAANADPLWSWHIWVTTYNPGSDEEDNTIPTVSQNPGRAGVPGGSVLRFGLIDENPTLNGSTQAIMDRNLGALSIDPAEGIKTWGKYYQFGRKDPMFTDLSDFAGGINGAESSGTVIDYIEGQVYIPETVLNPTKIVKSDIKEDWNSDEGRDNLWGDPGMATAKSIYDPCPPGWRIPFSQNSFFGPSLDDSSPAENGLYLYNDPAMYIPLAGYIHGEIRKHLNVGEFVEYYVGRTMETPENARVSKFFSWSTIENDEFGDYGRNLNKAEMGRRVTARPVRCVKH